MYSNIQIEKALDDFFAGRISDSSLREVIQINGLHDVNVLIEEHKMALQVIQHYNLEQQIRNVHLQFAHKPNNDGRAKVVRMNMHAFSFRIAAAVLLILCSYVFFQYNSSTKIYQSMYATYTVAESRSNSIEIKNSLVEAYKIQNYAVVIQSFKTLAKPDNRELFFAAMSYLETGSPAAAVALFERINSLNLAKGTQLYQDETDYYYALALLKLKQPEKAVKIFEQINSDANHTYCNSVSKWTIWKIKWFAH